jgi:hypothetical protein
LPDCPYGFGSSCAIPDPDAANGSFLKYVFGKPTLTVTDTGGSKSTTITNDGPSGYPAKDRGIYFTTVNAAADPKQGYIEITNGIILGPTFSF